MRSLKRAEMLPAVPWLSPMAFIQRHFSMIARRSSSSSFFMTGIPPQSFADPCRRPALRASLPVAARLASAHIAAAALRRARAGCGALVLVVEDDAALVEVHVSHLYRAAVALDRL